MNQPARITRTEAEDFLYREARLLDQRRFDEWFSLFTEDAIYWLPMGDEDEPGLGPSVLFDDHYFLARRVYRLLHTRVFAQRPASRTVHIVSNVEVGDVLHEGARPELVVYSAQVVYEIRPGSVQQYGLGDPRVMAGRCEHRIVTGEDGMKIAFKKFEMYDRDQPVESLAFLV